MPQSAVFFRALHWSNATLYTLIYLIMLMNKVCLPASGVGKKKLKYLSCIIKDLLKGWEMSWSRRTMESLKSRQERTEWWRHTAVRLPKAKQQGGIINSLWWIASFDLFLVTGHITNTDKNKTLFLCFLFYKFFVKCHVFSSVVVFCTYMPT